MFLTNLFMILGLTLVTAWPPVTAVNDSNAKVSFEVDSTWHLIEGMTSGVSGEIRIDPQARLTGSISVPVAKFDTDGESRDERLREVMAAEQFPKVVVTFDNVSLGCLPADAANDGGCSGTLPARLTIRDVTKDVVLPFTVSNEEGIAVVKGRLSLHWSDYGVEDPSILIAKLDPTVTVGYELRLVGAAPPAPVS
jgi:polyisoprenoid-binding protein YceI